MISIPAVPLIAFVILIVAVIALCFSKSRTLDTVLFSVFYAAVVVTVASSVVEFLSRQS